jgi:hypothetical protein
MIWLLFWALIAALALLGARYWEQRERAEAWGEPETAHRDVPPPS